MIVLQLEMKIFTAAKFAKNIFLFFFLCVTFNGFAQNKYIIHLKSHDKQQIPVKEKLEKLDSLEALSFIRQTIDKLHADGFLLASPDSLVWKKDTLQVLVFLGEQFSLEELLPGNVPSVFLNDIGYKQKKYQKQFFNWKEIYKLQQQILKVAHNQGYPFADIRLDSFRIENRKIRASLYFQPDDLILFDTINIVGTAKIKQKTLSALLRIHPEKLFNQELTENADRILNKLSFLQLKRSSQVIFNQKKAVLHIYADQRKANQFDGIIGFLPNEQQNNNRLLLTGEVNFKLNNLFNSAKSLSFIWQQIKPASPLLNLRYTHPVLFGTNLEADFQLNLLKQDSSFLNISRRLAIGQMFANTDKLSFFSSLYTSAVLGDSTQYKGLTRLPDALSVRMASYGAEFIYNRTNNFFYPRRGWDVNISVSVGNKEIIRNAAIKPDLYTGIKPKSIQFAFRTDVSKYFLLKNRTVLLIKARAGKVWNDYLSQNELFRLGGLSSIRGFNENTFFASGYGITTAEYRYFLEQETYFFFFFDYAVLETFWRNQQSYDQPFGTGTGISFSTKSGVFNFVYAIGKSGSQPFGFNFSKIHFGYISRF